MSAPPETNADTMLEAAERIADAWAEADIVRADGDAEESPVHSIARTMSGTDPSGEGAVVEDAAAAMLARTSPRNPRSFLPAWVPAPSNGRFLRTMRDLRDAMTDLVAERRASDAAGDDLPSTLADAEYDDGASMEREVVQDHLATVVFAGHETTAFLLTWTPGARTEPRGAGDAARCARRRPGCARGASERNAGDA